MGQKIVESSINSWPCISKLFLAWSHLKVFTRESEFNSKTCLIPENSFDDLSD